jgi:hypothetical protein
LQEELNLAREKRQSYNGTMIHFIYLGTQLRQNDWHVYEGPDIRVDVWAEIQLNVFTSARVGEDIESTCRAGPGRGLHYRVSAPLSGEDCSLIAGERSDPTHVVQDITFGVFCNEHGKAEFAMQVVRDVKGMTFTPEKR